jgi:hypothetical protein
MTEPDDYSNTRPISVAELLAKNGTIGAPPVGGRRRRRRGNADAVTVAELTGEIPIVRPDEPDPHPDQPEITPEDLESSEDPVEPESVVEAEPEPDVHDAVHDDVHDEVADAAEVTEADDELVEVEEAELEPEAEPEEQAAPTRRSPFGLFGRKSSAEVDAETMSPDPLEVGESDDVVLDGVAEPQTEDDVDAVVPDEAGESDSDIDEATDEDTDIDEDSDVEEDSDIGEDELPSYLRSSQDSLFGGPTGDGDVDEVSPETTDTVSDADTDTDDEPEQHREMSPLVHGLWIVGQSVVAVALGAGLFVAFDQLWKWNNIVALVLSVLVILGLVVGVRVVRKTEDIGSTLIAVAVGALVTLGPLALLQSG